MILLKRLKKKIENANLCGDLYKLKTSHICAISSVGRAPHLHWEGRGFKSLIAHINKNKSIRQGVFIFIDCVVM